MSNPNSSESFKLDEPDTNRIMRRRRERLEKQAAERLAKNAASTNKSNQTMTVKMETAAPPPP